MDVIPPGTRVRYHGSLTAQHGSWLLAGPCDCDTCEEQWDTGFDAAWYTTSVHRRGQLDLSYLDRYVLTSADGARQLTCVRRTSFTLCDRMPRAEAADPMVVSIELDPPATSGEFRATCVHLHWALRLLQCRIQEWTTHLTALGLPATITTHLMGVDDAVTNAANQAQRAVPAFTDAFAEAEHLAARGMTFTGEDAT
jgi:hypothetical protein